MIRCLLCLAAAITLSIAPAQSTSTLTIEPGTRANPWTHLNLHNEPDNFQFAIVSDRQGGGRAGVFEDAIRKLNLLQPEFVMSVGDLIPGYTTSQAALEEQWTEFQQMISKLQMPFFYLPGNHDLSNPLQHAEWEKRFEKKYYHFVYRDVLFLCLNSEDPVFNMGADQASYFRKALADNPDVRWTLVFLHQPLWLKNRADQEEGKDAWWQFEELLQGRPYTVFAGHYHRYTSYKRLDQKYFVLATTGGASPLRGIENYGEFDHVAWVTMTNRGPVIANLLLSGIWDENVRTERIAGIVTPAIRWAVVPKTVHMSQNATSSLCRLKLSNNADIPMDVQLQLEPGDVLDVSTRALNATIPPNSVSFRDLQIIRKDAAPRVDYEPVNIHWQLGFDNPEHTTGTAPRIELSGTTPIPVEGHLSCRETTAGVVVDGKLDDWDVLPYAWKPAPGPRKKGEKWSGATDSSFRFATRYDAEYVYLAVRVIDDVFVTAPGKNTWEQDCLEVRFDARPEQISSMGRGKQEGTDFVNLSMVPGTAPGEPRLHKPDSLPAGTKVAMERLEDGYTAEIAIPAAYLSDKQKLPWNAFRLNVAVNDYDAPETSSFLFHSWRPDWRSPENYEGSGTFYRM